MSDRGVPFVVYNSLSRRLEEFRPLKPDRADLYTCGPTVYNYPHIGNLRAYVFSDTLHRALLWKGYSVRKVVNITDVGHLAADSDLGEDKLEAAARTSVQSVYELARRYENAFYDDLAMLRIIPADTYARATDHVTEMIEFAAVIERRGAAYRLPSGLYFDTSKARDYGKLAVMRADEQREGARVEAVAGKRNKNDFVLWRTEQPGEQRLMRWNSPWGWGAPGWHLECSVMSILLLGPHFDLHTGGVDHRELHHVNEIAQSEAYLADGQDWVRYWMHNEFLNIKQAKMAKSEGTGLRLTELMDQGFEAAAYRLLLLTAHYRSQTEFSTTALESAATALRRLRRRVAEHGQPRLVANYADAIAVAGDERTRAVLDQFDAAISDDLNTARVIVAFQEALRDESISPTGQAVIAGAAETLLSVGLADPIAAPAVSKELEAEIEDLLAQRAQAREQRNWARADQIRDDLHQRGVRIKDTARGTAWDVIH